MMDSILSYLGNPYHQRKMMEERETILRNSLKRIDDYNLTHYDIVSCREGTEESIRKFIEHNVGAQLVAILPDIEPWTSALIYWPKRAKIPTNERIN